MRVSLLNRGLYSHPGGDLVQVEETAQALRKQGVWTRIEPEDPQQHLPHLNSVDLAHVFHVNFGFSKANWQHCIREGIPYVVTPIYYAADELGMTYDDQRRMFEEAAAVCPFTQKEADLIKAKTGFPGPYTIIPNGTAERFHSTSDPLQRTGVLAVAAREGTKGTGIVKELCEELGYPFTLATGVPKSDMPDLYKSHRVFVHAADLEVMSLVIGEALCANCRVLATNTNPGNSWYPGLVEFSPHMPAHKESLKNLLQWAYQTGVEGGWTPWTYEPNEAARNLTWGYVAEQLIKVYKEVLRCATQS
jgi:glycosyltransferase involved in cell wall biosynthesis